MPLHTGKRLQLTIPPEWWPLVDRLREEKHINISGVMRDHLRDELRRHGLLSDEHKEAV